MSEIDFKPIFEYMDQKFDPVDRNLQKIESSVADIYTALDEHTVILKRLDQERVFTSEWIKRIESEVEQHTKDLTNLKKHLGIA